MTQVGAAARSDRGTGERLLLVGLSVRMLAEVAHSEGYAVDAADLFGDRDTHAVAQRWSAVGVPGRLEIEPGLLLAVLERAAAAPAAQRPRGWIPVSGFDGRPELLAAGARVLPLLGNSAETVCRVREAAHFFARLEALGIPHPAVGSDPPTGPGWLRKDFGASGGWHIRDAAPGDPPPGRSEYFQRRARGEPLSALLIADGRRGRVIGCARQIVRPLGARPYVFRGCVGPVALPERVADRIADIADVLAGEFELRGLNGLDFLLDGERIEVLELNPRPTASVAIHAGALAGGVLHAHLRSCRGELAVDALRPAGPGATRGHQVVFARRAGVVSATAAAALAAQPWCHDRPAAGTGFSWGDPLCSVSAGGTDPDAVVTALAARRAEVVTMMELEDD